MRRIPYVYIFPYVSLDASLSSRSIHYLGTPSFEWPVSVLLLCPRGSRAATTGVSVKWRALHVNPDSFHGEEEINRRELRAN